MDVVRGDLVRLAFAGVFDVVVHGGPRCLSGRDVRQAMLRWDPTDFLSCLGVLPVEEERGRSGARPLQGRRR